MTEQDYKKFGALMVQMGEVSVGTEEMKRPSPQKIKTYFAFLKDLNFEIIQNNANKHFCKNKWFPAISELRNETNEDIEIEALKAFDIIKDLMYNFYCPELGAAGRQSMILQLESNGNKNLVPLLDKWGMEIATGNVQVARAQFLKSYKASIIDTNRLLEKKDDFIQIGEFKNGKSNF